MLCWESYLTSLSCSFIICSLKAKVEVCFSNGELNLGLALGGNDHSGISLISGLQRGSNVLLNRDELSIALGNGEGEAIVGICLDDLLAVGAILLDDQSCSLGAIQIQPPPPTPPALATMSCRRCRMAATWARVAVILGPKVPSG